MKKEKGFIILEILIAGIILTASVAATMYLFRVGAENLERVNNSNILSSKLPQAVSLIKSFDMDRKKGAEDLGDGVLLTWESRLIEKTRTQMKDDEGAVIPGMHEIYLYEVDFSMDNKRLERGYKINVFRYKAVVSLEETLF